MRRIDQVFDFSLKSHGQDLHNDFEDVNKQANVTKVTN